VTLNHYTILARDDKCRRLVRDISRDLRNQVEYSCWKGKAGKTDRAVMLIILKHASRSGRLDHYLDQRTMALNTGVTPRTANKSLHRLMDAGWIIRIAGSRKKPTDAFTYVINHARSVVYVGYLDSLISTLTCGDRSQASPVESPSEGQNPSSPQYRVTQSNPHRRVSRQALKWAGTELGVLLGSGATEVALCLTAEPRKISEIARSAGVCYSTASNALRKKLKPKGLAVLTPDGWIKGISLGEYVLDPDPGIVQKRRELYERERSEHYLKFHIYSECENDLCLRHCA
jgi:hypothetical protein